MPKKEKEKKEPKPKKGGGPPATKPGKPGKPDHGKIAILTDTTIVLEQAHWTYTSLFSASTVVIIDDKPDSRTNLKVGMNAFVTKDADGIALLVRAMTKEVEAVA
jgi:hypothetical protein